MGYLADRPSMERRAIKECFGESRTHYDGCPCSLLRLDDELAIARRSAQQWKDAHGRVCEEVWQFIEGCGYQRGPALGVQLARILEEYKERKEASTYWENAHSEVVTDVWDFLRAVGANPGFAGTYAEGLTLVVGFLDAGYAAEQDAAYAYLRLESETSKVEELKKQLADLQSVVLAIRESASPWRAA